MVCNGGPGCNKPVGPTCFFGVGSERYDREAVAGVSGWPEAEERGGGEPRTG